MAEIRGTSGRDFLKGTADDDLLRGLGADDILYGYGGNDILRGWTGDDSLHGDSGDDTLDGGAGNDHLEGGFGRDTYLLGVGSGQDVVAPPINDGTRDRILLMPGITTGNVTLTKDGYDLIVSINGTGDGLRVQDYFDGNLYIDIEFSDGTTWDRDYIPFHLSATEGDDWLHGTSGDDVLDGLGGDDVISGDAGNDTLKGGAGNDNIDGGDGDDILDGGAGNDEIEGEDGDDTYLFGAGSGQDEIWQTYGRGSDRILLDTGITNDDVTVHREGLSLVLSIDGTEDRLTVHSYFSRNDVGVGSIAFADGTTWDRADIFANLQSSGTNDTWYGTIGDDVKSGGAGDDFLAGEAGDDILDGNQGEDHLFGGDGQDVLRGGKGADGLLYGGGGSDRLVGGSGDDFLDGGRGSDTFLFGIGAGRDWISGYSGDNKSLDRIVLGVGITTDDVILTASYDGSDLKLSIDGTRDWLAVQAHFVDSAYEIDRIVFADGTVWHEDDILANLQTIEETMAPRLIGVNTHAGAGDAFG